MSRREFIGGLAGSVLFPLAARAQQPATPIIGFLRATSATDSSSYVAAFRLGLEQGGFTEGANVAVEYRWAEGDYDALPRLAQDLISAGVAVLVAGGNPTAMAAKRQTSKLPIVFAIGADPVKLGLVESLRRPGGNVTGVNFFAPQ